MRNRTKRVVAPEPKTPSLPDSSDEVRALRDDVKRLSALVDGLSKAETPAPPGLDLDQLGDIINSLNTAIQSAMQRPREIAVDVLRDEDGRVRAMVGVTDPKRIQELRKKKDPMGDWEIPREIN